VGVKSTEQFDRLVFDVRGAIQNIRNIVIGAICTNGTGGKAGHAGLTKFRIEHRRLASGNRLDGTNAETRRAI
jgi:hypothetical protein